MPDEREFNFHPVGGNLRRHADEIELFDARLVHIRKHARAHPCGFGARGEIRDDLKIRARRDGVEADEFGECLCNFHVELSLTAAVTIPRHELDKAGDDFR